MRLANKVAIITGSSSGIGRATALLFAREGAKVAVCANINTAGCEDTVAKIKANGGEAFFAKTDMTLTSDVKKFMDQTVSQFGRIDILMNNVGGGLGMAPFEQTDEEKFDKLVAVNLKSVFLAIQIALPELKKTKGTIINVGSMSALRPRPGVAIYAALKGGVITLTKTVAQELAPYGIRVNVLNPTVIATERAMQAPEEWRRSFAEAIPLKRLGTPEDVANAALFLASDESSFLTGDAINVDGGDSI